MAVQGVRYRESSKERGSTEAACHFGVGIMFPMEAPFGFLCSGRGLCGGS